MRKAAGARLYVWLMGRPLAHIERLKLMKTFVLAVAATALLVGGVANAQPDRGYNGQPDRGYNGQPGQGYNGQHSYRVVHSYNRGERIDREDWSRGQPVDYRSHHLRRPPRGYEWREVNGQYVLAAVATGLIMSILLNAGR